MYKAILLPLENRGSDETILQHVRTLARLTGAKLLLVHVADGFAARNFETLKLQESEEIRADREYLTSRCEELRREGFEVDLVLAMGDPASEIIKLSRARSVDLIAMATHGHKLIGDLLRGSTADKVRHEVNIPVLLLKAQK